MPSAHASPRDELLAMTNAFQVSQAIHVAATLGVADLLQEGPRAVAELATSTGTSPAALRRLLRALASVGIFQEAKRASRRPRSPSSCARTSPARCMPGRG